MNSNVTAGRSFGSGTGTGTTAQDRSMEAFGDTRIFLPPVDINRSIVPFDLPSWLGGVTVPVDLRHLYYGVGSGLPVFATGALTSVNTLAALGAGAGVGLVSAVVSSKVDRTINTPVDMARNWFREQALRRSMPMDSDEVLDYWSNGIPIHGIKRIYDDGTLEMWDGRHVAFIGMKGPNMEQESDHSVLKRSEGLTAGLRSDVEGNFCWYITTAEEIVDDFVEKYKDSVYSERFAGEDFELLREYLFDKIEYETETEPGRWRTRELLTYAVVEVAPTEVQSASETALTRVDALRGSIPGLSRSSVGQEFGSALSRQLKNRLDSRVSNMAGAMTSTNGVDKADIYRAGPTEVAMLASDYWGGTEIDMSKANGAPSKANLSIWPSIDEATSGQGPRSHRPTPVERQIEREYGSSQSKVDELIAGVERVDVRSGDQSTAGTRVLQSPDEDDVGSPEDVFEDDAISRRNASYATQLREHLLNVNSDGVEVENSNISPEQTAIAPTRFDIDDEYLVVGDEYVKTFWVTGWSPTPSPNLLEGLKRHSKLHPDTQSRATDVTFNMCIRVEDVSRSEVKEYLRTACNKLGVEVKDDPDEISTHSLDSVADYYRLMLFLLETGNAVRPWWVNGYVTIRADTKQGIEEAKDQLKKGYASDEEATVSLGRRDSVEDTKDVVFDALRSASPGLIIRDEPGQMDTLFKSGFPASRDHYNEITSVERAQLCLTGSIGAMFPFAEKVPQEPDGVEYGRHRATGLKMYADHFARGKSPHGIGVGDSGSSKTFSKGMQYLLWYLKEEGRTVVVADTMGGFRHFTNLLGSYGNHIRVDSTTTINPFEISAVTGSTRGDDIKPGEMTFQAAKEWLLNEVESQGGDPDTFSQTVEQLIALMYKRHDIDIDDPSTFDNGNPNMADFIETMDYLEENPAEATLGTSQSEVDNIVTEIKGLKRNLAGFSQLGRNSHMMGESDVSLEPGGFNYLDLESVESSAGGAGKSAMLQLLLKQVYELVKIAPKETVFLVDEAHLLLQTEWSLKWISTSTRHWRHFLGRIDAISHRPEEFISGPEDPEGHKDNIRSQASTIEFWNVEGFKREHAEAFFTDDEGTFNEARYNYVQSNAVTGESDKPFSTSIVQFSDHEGWYTNHIRAGPVITGFHSYDPDDHGAFEPYMQFILEGGKPAQYEELYACGEVGHYVDTDDLRLLDSKSQSQARELDAQAETATDGGEDDQPRDSAGRFAEQHSDSGGGD